MTEELKKDLEEGIRKFAFEKLTSKIKSRIEDELRRVLYKHNIQEDNSSIIIVQFGIDLTIVIRIGERRFKCKLSSQPVSFREEDEN